MVAANANPEKRLFISLITRDIGLTDAIIDLTDNAVNAAMRSLRNALASTDDFHKIFARKDIRPSVTLRVTYDDEHVSVVDDAAGIDFEAARDEVFRFGHSESYTGSRDRLSVYGIGMKRALFKIRNVIEIASDHKSGGFSLRQDVRQWADDKTVPWTFPISKRPPKSERTGTKIRITELHDEIKTRLSNKRFEAELISKLAKVYSFFLGRIIELSVNGTDVEATEFEIGSNFAHDRFKSDGVDCSITAGIAPAFGDRFLADTAGWFVFCNFRTVIYADKTPLTGWGNTMPLFQPKHRPFLGLVSFTSANPEALPWTTTKSSVNEDDPAWQEAIGRMAAVARPILRFLDTRYSAEGTEIDPARVAELSVKTENVFDAAVSKLKIFTPPSRKEAPRQVKVQYLAKVSELDKIRKHFSRPNMSASEIGRKTLEFFLRHEVSEE
jgi:Histidine kinase-, DNA gyrase B-, and HSP90-like ATPase